ncbi:tetratricopeptide repeat protein [Endozoicomonas arenosclerae]|uniref:tetratricopeptide repeat protein n=1 Tax=Endozoicomonas arenosclerae TaxID=1633495 RepID=UPI00078043E8|nr:SEL1-like repeat protein [Endozoicomonas arenosclerae]
MSLNKKCQGGLLAITLLFSLSGWAVDFASLVKQAKTGDQQAMLQAGSLLVTGKHKPEQSGQTESLLTPLVKAGNVKAELLLGKAYRDGLGGVSKDPKKGFELIELAAGRQGKSPEAQFELGKSYFKGAGTDRNLIAAYMWTSLSLEDSEGDFIPEARKQKQQLSELLNSAQRAKANELVSQIKTVYLK